MAPTPANIPSKKFVFATTNPEWGGSEILWTATAAVLAERGHDVQVFSGSIDQSEPRIKELARLSCPIHGSQFMGGSTSLLATALRSIADIPIKVLRASHLGLRLLFGGADLVVISQGGHVEGFLFAMACQRLKIPYVLICHKVSEFHWASNASLGTLRDLYANALHVFFVSKHNRDLLEDQIGLPMPHSSIVRNPFNASWTECSGWPDEAEGLELACVGRLDAFEKGQDLLLRILSSEQWYARPVHLTLYGEGRNSESLRQMAKTRRLSNVSFAGFVDDVPSIWRKSHALVLPSRCEGMPIAVVEAMLCGRVPIVTAVGGNKELVSDGQTGFIASAPTEELFADTMEKAWDARAEWRTIGAAASRFVRTAVPPDPAASFASKLLELVATQVSRAAVLPAQP